MIQRDHLTDHNKRVASALDFAMYLEIAAAIIVNFETIEQAAAALEYTATELKRKCYPYPVAANGEWEYRSWGAP